MKYALFLVMAFVGLLVLAEPANAGDKYRKRGADAFTAALECHNATVGSCSCPAGTCSESATCTAEACKNGTCQVAAKTPVNGLTPTVTASTSGSCSDGSCSSGSCGGGSGRSRRSSRSR